MRITPNLLLLVGLMVSHAAAQPAKPTAKDKPNASQDAAVAAIKKLGGRVRAWHLPLDHPYGAVTDADGNFTIKNLPVGTHKFRIWHERQKNGGGDRGGEGTIAKDGVAVNDNLCVWCHFFHFERRTIPVTSTVPLPS